MCGNASEEYLLPESDVRAMVRLLADVAVTPGGVIAQKRRLVEGIAELTDTDHWLWNVTRITPGKAPVAVSILHNISEKQLMLLADENYARPNNDYNQAFHDLSEDGKHWTRRLEDMLDLTSLPPDSLYRHQREVDMAESLFSMYPVPGHDDMVSAIGLHRGFGREPYTRREAKIAHILMSEVRWLHELGVPGEDGRQAATLSPRLQTVLTMLVDGQTAKRIAYHLELSEHTVRGYIKDIYRRFNVGSRAELMRRFMIGDGGDAA